MLFTMLFSTVGTTSALVGDFNGSGTLSTSDAVYLLYHTLFGQEEYPINQKADLNGDGKIDSEDATYLLFNVLFGEEDYALPFVNVTLNTNGVVNTYELAIGSELNAAPDIFADNLKTYKFIGWYDSTFNNLYTTVPNYDITLYAKF